MPTYEYACSACGHQFEEFQSIKAKPVVVCPKCKKRKVKRLISSGAGFIFKGSGFYTTDYRSDSYKASAKSDSAPSKETAAATPGKTDSATSPPVKSDSKSPAPAPAAPAPATSTPAPTPSKGKK